VKTWAILPLDINGVELYQPGCAVVYCCVGSSVTLRRKVLTPLAFLAELHVTSWCQDLRPNAMHSYRLLLTCHNLYSSPLFKKELY
jgi:hypothetical protein